VTLLGEIIELDGTHSLPAPYKLSKGIHKTFPRLKAVILDARNEFPV